MNLSPLHPSLIPQLRYVSGHRWIFFLTLIFLNYSPIYGMVEGVLKLRLTRMLRCYFKKDHREGKRWMLWLLTFVAFFICVRGGLAFLWLRCHGEAVGETPRTAAWAAVPSQRCSCMWRMGGAQGGSDHGGRDSSCLVTWLCRDPWGWQTCSWKRLWILCVRNGL